jgi:hypothetical protein
MLPDESPKDVQEALVRVLDDPAISVTQLSKGKDRPGTENGPYANHETALMSPIISPPRLSIHSTGLSACDSLLEEQLRVLVQIAPPSQPFVGRAG